ncbi:MAG: ornithine cyclodeaminase family protein [Candidatus Saccharicenans sp.]|nr:ornithine cyclodeaminase family protein [Candidatus Saccharicenans sp.]
MRIVDRDELSRLLTMAEVIELVERGFLLLHLKKVLMPPRAVFSTPYHDGSILYMPVLIEDDRPYLVTKIITVYPENSRLFGLPVLQGLVLVFDAVNGTPLVALDAAFTTAMRTGAAGGVAAKYLARQDSKVVTLFGAGPQARTQLEAVCALLQIEKCYLVSYQDPREESFAREMGEKLKIEVIITADRKSAVEQADVIICATTSRTPLFDGTWLRPGAHITAIGSFKPEVRELDSETVRRAKVYVDSREAAREEAGDLIIPVREGVFAWDKIEAELGEVIAGEKNGRETPEEITLFKSVGLAVQDAVVAVGVLKKIKGSE